VVRDKRAIEGGARVSGSVSAGKLNFFLWGGGGNKPVPKCWSHL